MALCEGLVSYVEFVARMCICVCVLLICVACVVWLWYCVILVRLC